MGPGRERHVWRRHTTDKYAADALISGDSLEFSDMTRDQIIANAFAAIDKMLRPASIARIGGFRPPLTPITSWFGGNFLAYPDDRWPDCGDGPMLPLLQVLVEELP